jgi:hypothetical protein
MHASVGKQVKCPHSGGTTYRLLKELPRAVECQNCGHSFSIEQAQQLSAPIENPKQPKQPEYLALKFDTGLSG